MRSKESFVFVAGFTIRKRGKKRKKKKEKKRRNDFRAALLPFHRIKRYRETRRKIEARPERGTNLNNTIPRVKFRKARQNAHSWMLVQQYHQSRCWCSSVKHARSRLHGTPASQRIILLNNNFRLVFTRNFLLVSLNVGLLTTNVVPLNFLLSNLQNFVQMK